MKSIRLNFKIEIKNFKEVELMSELAEYFTEEKMRLNFL